MHFQENLHCTKLTTENNVGFMEKTVIEEDYSKLEQIC